MRWELEIEVLEVFELVSLVMNRKEIVLNIVESEDVRLRLFFSFYIYVKVCIYIYEYVYVYIKK